MEFVFLFYSYYCESDESKWDEVGGTCNVRGSESEEVKERINLEN
jgi:hypothetical protein